MVSKSCSNFTGGGGATRRIFFFDKFVPAGLSLENLDAEKKNAIGTMLTAVREDISQLPRTAKAQRRDMDRLAVSVADAAFDARLAERRHYVVLAHDSYRSRSCSNCRLDDRPWTATPAFRPS